MLPGHRVRREKTSLEYHALAGKLFLDIYWHRRHFVFGMGDEYLLYPSFQGELDTLLALIRCKMPCPEDRVFCRYQIQYLKEFLP